MENVKMQSTSSIIARNEIVYLAVDSVRPNPYQPRKQFDRQRLNELATSIKEFGVMQPISVRLINGYRYELVSGERRLRAAKLAGLSQIPAIVVSISDQTSAMLAMIENLQRQDLNYLEEAEGYNNLLTDYRLTQEELAERIGKSQSTIANKLRLLKLSREVQKKLFEYDLTERHARALLAVPDEEVRLEVIEIIHSKNLNVKETERLIEGMMNKKEGGDKVKKANVKWYIGDMRFFTNTIKEAVEIMNSSGITTDYLVTESEDGCEIKISVNYVNSGTGLEA